VGAAGAIVTSSDGIDWSVRDSGTANNLVGIGFGKNQFVAVGDGGTILTSSNGLQWIMQNVGATNMLSTVAYGNGSYVVLGYSLPTPLNPGGIIISFRSTDGVNWLGPYAQSFGFAHALIFANNLFVATAGIVVTSPEGVNWTSPNAGWSDLIGVAFGNDTFVAVGQHTSVSPDGTNWTAISSGGGNSITYGDEGFVAPGFLFPNSIPVITTSLDGSTWSRRGVEGGIGNATFGNGIYVGLGGAGTILKSTPVEAQALPLLGGSLSSRGFELSMTAQPGYSYTLQSSPILASPAWTNVYTFSATQAVTSYFDSTASARSGGFYRITSP
jgi:hypothetical protein